MDTAAQPRIGNWMQTYTGRQFWPIDPRPDEIFIEDIAHALGNACRYAGHCITFYSVAEHSVLMARAVPQEFKAWALLHDASEAYLVDVPRPLKPFLTGYADLEDRVMAAVATRFGLAAEMPAIVKDTDNRILHDERRQNMMQCEADWDLPGSALGIELHYWTPYVAARQFEHMFHALGLEHRN
jgi:hypothetical protein